MSMTQPELSDAFRKIIIANELDGDLDYALKFSDPDGVRSGKSGWSFGVCQFDLKNNPQAASCLRAIGFTEAEISGLIAQTIDPEPLEVKLKAGAALVKKWDSAQLSTCLFRAESIFASRGIKFADDAALLAAADYANQYYLSNIDKPGYLVHYLLGLKAPFTARDILAFKLKETPYGQKHPEDCQRRYDNLVRIVNEANA